MYPGKPLWYDGIIERGLAMTIPLSAAIIAGILYGAIRSVALTKNEDEKNEKRPNPYLESIIVTLIVYLIVSLVMNL